MTESKNAAHANEGGVVAECLQVFRSLFVAREDAYAIWKGDQPTAVREPLSDHVLTAHLAGEYRAGTYLIQLDGRTPFLVFDIDVQERSLVKRILRRLRKMEVVAYVERSKSKGYHIWVFFDKPLRAAQARAFAKYVLRGLENEKIEIFPKQDYVTEDGVGNCIWLPLCGFDIRSKRTVFLDDDLKSIRKQWRLLRHIKRVPKKRIQRICNDLPPTIKRFPRLPESKEKSGLNLPTCAQSILFKGVEDGHRNVALFTLTKHLRNAGIEQDRVEDLVSGANEQCQPPLEGREVASIVSSVFKGRYTSLGCEDSFIASLCGERCPVKSRKSKASSSTSAATRLVDLAKDVTFFHTPDKEAYGTMRVQEHEETWRLKDQVFKRWLAAKAYEGTGAAPSSQALCDALGALEGVALYGGPEQDVSIRLGQSGNKIYLDLCDKAWQVVEISCEGWQIISESPIKFRRTRGMKALPIPQRGGTISELRSFINLASENDFVLLVSWLVAGFNPRGPYPVAVLQGEAGSAKSTGVRVIRELLDPNTTPLRSEPRETRDLMIAARNSWCLAFDNISHLG
jgi:hypothetical protein